VPEIMAAAVMAGAVQTGRAVSAFEVVTIDHAEAIVQRPRRHKLR
jgi:hypothetical protein